LTAVKVENTTWGTTATFYIHNQTPVVADLLL